MRNLLKPTKRSPAQGLLTAKKDHSRRSYTATQGYISLGDVSTFFHNQCRRRHHTRASYKHPKHKVCRRQEVAQDQSYGFLAVIIFSGWMMAAPLRPWRLEFRVSWAGWALVQIFVCLTAAALCACLSAGANIL